MWRRFGLQPVILGVQHNPPSRRAIMLRPTAAILSNEGKSRIVKREGKERRQVSDTADMNFSKHSKSSVELESPGKLAGEVKMMREETQLMSSQLQERNSQILSNTNDEQTETSQERDWTEPSLEDLDRSIPQVDCAFIANLIRSRNARRKEFLHNKARVKAKVEQLSKQQASSVLEAAKYPILGGLSGSRIASSSNSNSSSSNGVTTISSGDDDDAPIAVSPEVLAQLSDEDRDALLSSRPEYDDGFVLLDCRTVNEVTSWGMIEGAKVLPAHEMFDGFHLTPDEFEVEFGFPKPRPEEKIICYCQYGPRSLMAAQILSWMGYMNVLHFRDGYYEWGKQYNLLLRRWMVHDKESGNEIRRQAAFQAGLELQREIAPEFNELPMSEAARYKIDTTRSRGKMIVGEGVREEAYSQIATLVSGMQPPLLPGVLDDADRAVGVSGAIGRREQQMKNFLQETTGMDAHKEDTRPPMGLAEVQAKVMDAFTRSDGGSHAPPR
ncbi:Rhodanese-like protein [Trypanosoma theileri]|uniref:Rhodanese-like protein n=1 Tax=Trypanosoma theileri TaxID=67003 RepID=A0A1X0NF45_9TRYP|nr:Rhodanese-like protein [Trypanosoma theileri]ORC83342.1 Rhodanese-like protein [Trypanosoma theileri]